MVVFPYMVIVPFYVDIDLKIKKKQVFCKKKPQGNQA